MASLGSRSVAFVIGGAGLLKPAWIRPVYLVLTIAAWPVGWAMSFVLLGIIYYLVVTPLGLLLRLFGHDPLTRRFEGTAKSYWVERPVASGFDRYFRQF